MDNQENKPLDREGFNKDLPNTKQIDYTRDEGVKEKPQEEDTSKEIISTHAHTSQSEGVDEQYGGDAADNRDDEQVGENPIDRK
ncbi:hypothetical protein [Pedobacter xixiisoli]|uniref:Uncharacterized protein n=1 Tax=Pedobacter xixiisoli TaxID=1476464 RepID=A0A285ZSG9_9SPHI|nr:hypothetical protein [Pedobacter xixiisoli]SOD12586.1 hypothetical protein SAMN06297358_0745 [Pedobacter xixiisoli]